MKKIVLLLIYFLNSLMSVAQPGGGGDPGGGEPVPLTGLGILLASGAFLGAKRIYDLKKRP